MSQQLWVRIQVAATTCSPVTIEALTCSMCAGPLEAVIANLGREIEAAAGQGRKVQRRWLAKQTELVNMQANCTETAEQLQRLRSEFVVWQQRHIRLSRLCVPPPLLQCWMTCADCHLERLPAD